jgi:hypothetical protein
METNTDLKLKRVIDQHVASLESDLTVRNNHPSYGVTKAGMLAKFHQLEGLIYAYRLVLTGENSAHFQLQVNDTARPIGVDLWDLQNRIKKAK